MKHVFNVRTKRRYHAAYKYTYSVGTSPRDKLKHAFNVRARTRQPGGATNILRALEQIYLERSNFIRKKTETRL